MIDKHGMNEETIFFLTKYLSINISILFVVYLMFVCIVMISRYFADG